MLSHRDTGLPFPSESCRQGLMLGPQLPPESWLPAHLEVPLETGPRSACNQQLVAGAISPLQTNLSSYKCSKMQTVLTLRSCKLVHVSGLHCPVGAPSARGCAFVCFTAQRTVVYFYITPSMSGSKSKSSDVAGTLLPRRHWILFPRG